MGRASLLALLACCTFEHGRIARDPGIDAATDAAIDAAADAAADWSVIEILTVPTYASGTTPQVVSSAMPLALGREYKLRVSGRFSCTSGGIPADAEYWDLAQPRNTASSVDFGLGIDELTVDGTKTPASWGPYSPDNVYEAMYVGTGMTLSAALYDTVYDNNTGTLTLEILAR